MVEAVLIRSFSGDERVDVGTGASLDVYHRS